MSDHHILKVNKKLERSCPNCNKSMVYKSRRGYWWGNKHNLTCRGCTRKLRGLSYPSRKGCSMSDDAKEKIGIAVTNRHRINGHPMLGKHHTKDAISKIQTGISGQKNGMYGKKHSIESRIKISKSRIGKPGPVISPKGILKLRLKRIVEISNAKYNGEQIIPSYNLKSCNFFKKLNETFNWKGQYATNDREYHIKELGYFVDYYEPSLNLVIEWDESKHYNIDGTLKDKDKHREEEIKFYLKCKFIRIKEDEFQEDKLLKNIYDYTANKQ